MATEIPSTPIDVLMTDPVMPAVPASSTGLLEKITSDLRPHFEQLIVKTQELWGKLHPYLLQFVTFLKTPLGIACTLLASTVICMKISQYSQDRLISLIFMIAGIVTSVLSGAHLLHAGLIPQSVLIQF